MLAITAAARRQLRLRLRKQSKAEAQQQQIARARRNALNLHQCARIRNSFRRESCCPPKHWPLPTEKTLDSPRLAFADDELLLIVQGQQPPLTAERRHFRHLVEIH